MIYETVARCVEDLTSRWGAIETTLDDLLRELDSRDPFRDEMERLRDSASGYAQSAPDPATAVTGAGTRVSPIRELLRRARTALELERKRATDAINANDAILNQLEQRSDEGVARPAKSVRSGLEEIRSNAEGCLKEIEELTTPEGAFSNVSGIRGSVDQIATYPVLTRETGWARPSGGSAADLAAAPLGRSAETAIREILGWRPNPEDPKAFVAALTQSFECTETDGRSVCKHVPRGYSVQADLGAVTGAQASIYSRAKNALDDSLPLLRRLTSLRPDADEEESEAMREIVITEWSALVDELGREGGPRVQRVDTLFKQLLGPNIVLKAEKVGGDLGQLRRELGLDRDAVNTIDEEENLTNFLIVVDYISSLRQSWEQQKPFFFQTDDVFFGTQMVLLSRSLGVVVESVDEVRYAMDSVFLGSAERQSLRLEFADEAPIFIADLLDWTQRFASDEGPHLIREGGKRGVRSSIATLEELKRLWRDARTTANGGQQKPQDAPEGYATKRVQSAIDELGDHIAEALELADAVKSPNGRPGIPKGAAINTVGVAP